MLSIVRALPRLAAGLAFGLSVTATVAAAAETRFAGLEEAVAAVENQLGARVGLSWFHRNDERFLMNSTFKVPLCGAVLARVDAGTLSLDDKLNVEQKDIVSYAPVTEKRVGAEMTIDALCRAAIDISDNTAANMLIDHLGGPRAVTRFFESTGDTVSRLDRSEPDLNTFIAGDPRDTTTPVAATGMLSALLLGDVLSPGSRDQLREWMSHGGVTGKLLRDKAPKGWRIFDKSGSGSHSRNLVAVVVPEGRAPWIVTIFISDVNAPFETRNAAVKSLSGAVAAAIED